MLMPIPYSLGNAATDPRDTTDPIMDTDIEDMDTILRILKEVFVVL